MRKQEQKKRDTASMWCNEKMKWVIFYSSIFMIVAKNISPHALIIFLRKVKDMWSLPVNNTAELFHSNGRNLSKNLRFFSDINSSQLLNSHIQSWSTQLTKWFSVFQFNSEPTWKLRIDISMNQCNWIIIIPQCPPLIKNRYRPTGPVH